MLTKIFLEKSSTVTREPRFWLTAATLRCRAEDDAGRKPRVARDHPPRAKPIGRESMGWARERKPKCWEENVSLMLLASSRYFCELPLSTRFLFLRRRINIRRRSNYSKRPSERFRWLLPIRSR